MGNHAMLSYRKSREEGNESVPVAFVIKTARLCICWKDVKREKGEKDSLMTFSIDKM